MKNATYTKKGPGRVHCLVKKADRRADQLAAEKLGREKMLELREKREEIRQYGEEL